MEKKLFQEEYEKIEVPKEDVLQAIKTGVRRANSREVPQKNNKKFRPFVLSSVAAAAIFISSSFIFPSMSRVMADVPLLGNIYVSFNDLVGRSLASQELITQLNETSNSKGIDVSITSAYYDGAVIGVTFDVTGNLKPNQDGRLEGVYEIFGGDKGIADSIEMVYMEPSENGYTGHIQLNYPKLQLPSDTSFPLEFKSIGRKTGDWKFNIPIKQLPYETVAIDKDSITNHAEVKVHFDSIIHGKASTSINYTATFPSEGKYDQVRLEVFDDFGKKIDLLSDGIDLETIEVNGQIIVKGRTIIPQSLIEKTSYLEIQPKVALFEANQIVTLNEKTPVHLKSSRQNLSLTVEKIKIIDNKFTVDFQINNGEKRNKDLMFFNNFARNDVLLVKESEKEVYLKPIKHSVKALDKGNLRFRSTFDIGELDNFSPDKYVLRVNMNSLSANIPLELETVKINLK